MKVSQLAIASLPVTAAFSPGLVNMSAAKSKNTLNAALVSDDGSKTIFDPLGLYPDDSPERMAGIIEPLEGFDIQQDKKVVDPLGIYTDKAEVSTGVEMSASLPFVPRPPLLDGSLPGDRGFDPFNFASDASALQWYRASEIKHARLAMLATVGWSMAELYHKGIAGIFDLPVSLASEDRVPSVLNDGLSHAPNPAFWIGVVAASGLLEIRESVMEGNDRCKLNPGDLGFDPLQMGGRTEEEQHFMQEAEIFNGRLGMLAITGFAIQEWWLNSSVVDQVPIFFKPINVALEQLMSGGNISV